MVIWRLKSTMDSYGITRYALQQKSGVAMNTLRSMYDGSTERPDLTILHRVIKALREITGKEIVLNDVLEWQK